MSRRGCGCGGHHGYYGGPGDGLIMLAIMLCLAVAAMPIVGGYLALTGETEGKKMLGWILLIIGIIIWVVGAAN